MYYSQLGQDSFVDELLNKKENGFFIEIGANNGKSHSNTLFFEEKRNWSGICVEPLADKFQELNEFRKSINLNICISDFDGDTEFTHIKGYANELSGISDDYHPSHIDRINHEVESHGGSVDKIMTPVRKLQTILDEYGITEVDYCSIDTEGSELKIIKSIDFSRTNIKIFGVENNYGDSDIYHYLISKGYTHHIKLHWEDIYVKNDILINNQ